jgi:Xaa-Pro aminopeptidase
MVLGLATARMLERQAAQSGFILKTDTDVTDLIWHDRASLPTAAVYSHMAPFAIVSRAENWRKPWPHAELGAQHHLISTVDDIAWLLNLRGGDVSYNPVFISHLLLNAEQGTLFIAEGKVQPDCRRTGCRRHSDRCLRQHHRRIVRAAC